MVNELFLSSSAPKRLLMTSEFNIERKCLLIKGATNHFLSRTLFDSSRSITSLSRRVNHSRVIAETCLRLRSFQALTSATASIHTCGQNKKSSCEECERNLFIATFYYFSVLHKTSIKARAFKLVLPHFNLLFSRLLHVVKSLRRR